jgi:DNA-binding transcriptional MerR regulator
MKQEITTYTGNHSGYCSAQIIIQSARITLQFLYQCEEEGLVRSYGLEDGTQGYRHEDVFLLARIWRLHTDLGLDLPAIEVILNMRHQIDSLHTELQATRRQMAAREKALLNEIRWLREQLYAPSEAL